MHMRFFFLGQGQKQVHTSTYMTRKLPTSESKTTSKLNSRQSHKRMKVHTRTQAHMECCGCHVAMSVRLRVRVCVRER